MIGVSSSNFWYYTVPTEAFGSAREPYVKTAFLQSSQCYNFSPNALKFGV